ncbi:uncharacterized protein [Periplaneta americana]|uniref:uncharacterized protein n=1 Tax=Periplaneta americana TaxID=6978 RepID=UPI0037E9A624
MNSTIPTLNTEPPRERQDPVTFTSNIVTGFSILAFFIIMICVLKCGRQRRPKIRENESTLKDLVQHTERPYVIKTAEPPCSIYALPAKHNDAPPPYDSVVNNPN